MTYADQCVVEGKPGLTWLDRRGPYVVIANKVLYERGNTSRFAVVHMTNCFVDSVYSSRQAATRYLQKKIMH